MERLRAVRQAIGPYTPLMVDANQRWSVGEAITRARAMEEFNLFWLEEPILAEDHAGYARLSRTVNVALAAGEGEHQAEQFLDLFQRGAVQFVQADACRVGGVTPWMRMRACRRLPPAHGAAPGRGVVGTPVLRRVQRFPGRTPAHPEPEQHRIHPQPGPAPPGGIYAPGRPGARVQFDFTALEPFRLA